MAAESEDDLVGLTGDERILHVAKSRFKRAAEWEAIARLRGDKDYKFANADSYNMYQWPNETQAANGGPNNTPVKLTVNKTRQHNLQIINEAKQNKPGVNIRPTGGDATYESAQAFEGCVRYIEKISHAEQAYDNAMGFMVISGIGYWRVITDYLDNDSFDQDIFIRRIKNPNSVYLDPDINEIDGSDARFGFVFEEMPRDEFEAQYPAFKDEIGSAPIGNDSTMDGWIQRDTIRVAEYFAKSMKKDLLVAFTDPDSGETVVTRKSQMPPAVWAQLKEDTSLKTRKIEEGVVNWYKIAGDKIIERGEWPGKYIPIVRIVGEETVIGGQLDRKGHTRAMIDPQNIYNYWTSAAVRQVAFQTVSPWLIPVGGTDNLETYYARLNSQTPPSFVPYNALDEQGNALPAPQRVEPPVMADAFIKGMTIAQTELMMASGQYQSQFGQNENATSGKAINERQRQGDTATYHYIDALAIGIRFTGVILIDLIPKIYDTTRVVQILAEDGKEQSIKIDPAMKDAYKKTDEDKEGVASIFNPSVGRYSVVADVGPSYATKRQEAWNAMTQIIAQNKEMAKTIGDLLFANADFPGADEISKRLKRMLPEYVLGEGETPEIALLKKANEDLKATLAEVVERLAEKDRELKNKTADHNIRSYEAESKRLTAASNAEPEIGLDVLRPMIIQIVTEMMQQPDPEATPSPMQNVPINLNQLGGLPL